MYVPVELRCETQQDLDKILKYLKNPNEEIGLIPPRVLIMIDYLYHRNDTNYDNGLSFLDRIYAKIGQFHPNWVIDQLKNLIVNSNGPEKTYEEVIEMMFKNPSDCVYYGF